MTKKIAVYPPPGMTFESLFAKDCPWYAPGVADRYEYLMRKQFSADGYELCSADSGDRPLDASVVAIIHWSSINISLLKRYPDKIHIYYVFEPHINRPYNTKMGICQLSHLMDYSISLYENVENPTRGIYSISTIYNFEINFSRADSNSPQYLLATVSADKSALTKGELYSQRRAVIDWFEENAPDEFRFWGAGWRERYQHFKTYGGQAECKLTCLSQAKFALCFENIRDQTGYITEKLFDGMNSGAITVYWGAKNITDHIPADCFIDYRSLQTPEKLYQYLHSLSDNEINSYRERIRNWLSSTSPEQFSYQRWVERTEMVIEQGKRAKPSALHYVLYYIQLYIPVVRNKLHRLLSGGKDRK